MPKRRMKAYMPRWIAGVLIPFFVLVWGVVTWTVWMSGAPRDPDDVMGWWIATIALVFAAILIGVMALGKLPAYVIEVEEDDEPG